MDGPLQGADRLLQEVVAGHFLPSPPAQLGVAVSGGSDSTALLELLAEFAEESGATRLHVVTVNHNLRPEAADEAAMVAEQARKLGLSHDTLNWRDWNGQGNLQDAARSARHELIGQWARERNLSQVALGHTADDQAETVLMRMLRVSGADGLACMSPRRMIGGITFVRPMLGLRRADLRAFLERRGIRWAEDPSNHDTHFERVRMRQALDALAPLGLTVPVLCGVAENAASVRDTLDWYSFTEASETTQIENGDVVMPMHHLRRLRPEILRRILINALHWVAGPGHGPRRKAMVLLAESLRSGTGMTLHGCRATVRQGQLRVTREFSAVQNLVAAPGELWDGRWQISGPWPEGAEIRAAGEAGLAQCPDWRNAGIPRVSALAMPAVWRGETLVAAPLHGWREGWNARLVRDRDAFYAAFLTH